MSLCLWAGACSGWVCWLLQLCSPARMQGSACGTPAAGQARLMHLVAVSPSFCCCVTPPRPGASTADVGLEHRPGGRGCSFHLECEVDKCALPGRPLIHSDALFLQSKRRSGELHASQWTACVLCSEDAAQAPEGGWQWGVEPALQLRAAATWCWPRITHAQLQAHLKASPRNPP